MRVHRLVDKLPKSLINKTAAPLIYLLMSTSCAAAETWAHPFSFDAKRKLDFQNEHTVILLLLVDAETRSYMLRICRENKYQYHKVVDPIELVQTIEKQGSAIVFVDYEAVSKYGARIYSRVKVACPSCNIILLCDQDHQSFIKEAMEHGAYACIMSPYEEWEVLTMIRNIIAKKKLRGRKKGSKTKGP